MTPNINWRLIAPTEGKAADCEPDMADCRSIRVRQAEVSERNDRASHGRYAIGALYDLIKAIMTRPRTSLAFPIAAIAGLLVTQAVAAVLILEGAESPSAPPSAAPPSLSAPSGGTVTSAPTQQQQETPPPTGNVTLPSAATTPSAAPPASLPPHVESAVPSGATAPALLSPAGPAPANQAGLSVEMLPSRTVTVGSVVSFRITSKKPGYVVLMDVDAAGHVSQIYPSTASLTRATRANGNYVNPRSSLTIPLAADPYAGVRYVVSPPNGQAIIVGILSPSPVQLLDLPDIPAEILGNPALVLAYMSKRTHELRIPDQENRLNEAKWSFDARPYTIQ